MSVARVTEVIASSKKSFDDAIEAGVERAAKTLKNVTGAWVQDQKVTVSDGKIDEYRFVLRVTFVLED
ncbi:dodecin family protein [Nereida sp.]|uniref:dodecin family protein n=1 Tax=Nereida sp. TaxID=2736090 RepID=UPI003F6A0B7B